MASRRRSSPRRSEADHAVAEKKDTPASNGASSDRWKSAWVRTESTIYMIAAFFIMVYAGHLALVAGIFLLQLFIFKEMLDLRDKTIFRKLIQDRRREKLPLFIDWCWFGVTTYYIYGGLFFSRFSTFFYKYDLLATIAGNHRMISFGLYCVTLLAFVLTLEPGLYKVQFKQLGWTFLVLMFTVLQSSFYLATVFEGMIWLFLPASMVIANDIWAYIVGFLVGRHPLIQLSPKKTWEGFFGGMVATLFFGMLFSSFLARYDWMICPKTDLFSWSVTCSRGYVFTPTNYQLPDLVKSILRAFGSSRTFVTLMPVQIHTLPMALFASLIAPFGGFFASGFKRGVNLKDFGDSIPGHGGLADRMDCQLLMGVFAYLYYANYIRTTNPQAIMELIFTLPVEAQKSIYQLLGNHLAGKPPRDFKFPFKPYESQSDFMNRMYDQLDGGGVAIFESPTGTGKSLSIICSALLWLSEHGLQGSKPSLPNQEEKQVQEAAVPSWVNEQYSAIQKSEKAHAEDELKKQLQKRNDRLKRLYNDTTTKTTNEQKRARPTEENAIENFEVEYDSSDESNNRLERLLEKRDDSESDEDEAVPTITKVFYASRTHSQLAQFSAEIKRCNAPDVHVVTLGSRKALCVNESVRMLESLNRINDRCLDLQQQKTSPGCVFLKETSVRVVRDRLLAQISDVEEATRIGRHARGCAYYGARKASLQAEIILLPYNMLLHQATRESLGVDLKGNVVVIDEAHNIIDAILDMHSVTLTLNQLQVAQAQLRAYEDRYKDRLKLKNLWYIRQVLLIIELLLGAINKPRTKDNQVSIHSVNDFLFASGFDNFNLFKIEKYFQRSGIVRKLNGFVEAFLQKNSSTDQLTNAADSSISKHRPAMSVVEEFFICLSKPSTAGRIAINSQTHTLQYVQLDPEPSMRQIVEEARAVILAGGTLSPMDDLAVQLFGRQVAFHTWDHVIPSNHVLALSISSGLGGQSFDFTFSSRSSAPLIADLGESILSIASSVPDGMVVFFPSYAYEEEVVRSWTASGLLARLQQVKAVLREPHGQGSGVEDVLRAFRTHVETPRTQHGVTGALLSCVVGGKLSEGINFADGLGRCVVMVGMPYANRSDLVLRERMSYLDAKYTSATRPRPGEDFYESLCTRAVNQSIGRAIRHAADYAVIVLLDTRFSRSQTITRLPGWIGKSHSTATSFDSALGAIRGFFAEPWKVQQQQRIENERLEAARQGMKQ